MNKPSSRRFTARSRRPRADVRWIHGSLSAKHNDPEIQIHAYDEHVHPAQNKAVNYEAPFIS